MDRRGIKELVREILGPNFPLEDQEHWVGMPCPFARWTHARGRDEKPSAGISVHRNGKSIFRCFTCAAKGMPLEGFLRRLDSFTGDVPAAFIRDAVDNEFFGGGLPAWGQTDPDETDKGLPVPLDKETYLELYDPAEDHWYLERRGITSETSRTLQLMVDPGDSEGDERILFPVFGPKGDLYGFTGRAVHTGTARLKVRDYHGLKKSKLLLGAHLIDPKRDQFVIVVEGLFDCAMLVQYDLPVVASMMAHITPAQAAILKDFGLPVYAMYDGDEAGDKARQSLKEALVKHLPVMKTRFPKVRFRDRDTGKIRWAQDPDEFSREQILWMLQDAKLM